MTLTDLERIVPAAFSTSPSPDVSEVYEFVPSLPIIRDLVERGWQIRSAHQNSKDKDKDPYASHRVVFDVPGTPLRKEVGEVWPTATLYNSHNRTRRVSFSVGFFRTTCSNQAQISILGMDMSKIHIVGWGGMNIQSMIEDVLTEFALLPPLMDKMKATTLNASAQLNFARQALSVRRYGKPDNAALYTERDAMALTTPRRPSDRGDSLWLAYNRVQENILYASSRGINEVTQNRKINVGLWELAKSYVQN